MSVNVLGKNKFWGVPVLLFLLCYCYTWTGTLAYRRGYQYWQHVFPEDPKWSWAVSLFTLHHSTRGAEEERSMSLENDLTNIQVKMIYLLPGKEALCWGPKENKRDGFNLKSMKLQKLYAKKFMFICICAFFWSLYFWTDSLRIWNPPEVNSYCCIDSDL